MPMGGRSDCDIGKARRMTTAAHQVGQGTGYLRCRAGEGQHAIAIEMQHDSLPSCKCPVCRADPEPYRPQSQRR